VVFPGDQFDTASQQVDSLLTVIYDLNVLVSLHGSAASQKCKALSACSYCNIVVTNSDVEKEYNVSSMSNELIGDLKNLLQACK
jgi:hypothetical protein